MVDEVLSAVSLRERKGDRGQGREPIGGVERLNCSQIVACGVGRSAGLEGLLGTVQIRWRVCATSRIGHTQREREEREERALHGTFSCARSTLNLPDSAN